MLRDLIWFVGVWLYFGLAMVVYILFCAVRPLPKNSFNDWVGIVLFGPIGWFIVIRNEIQKMKVWTKN